MPRTLLVNRSTQDLIEATLLASMSDSPVKKAAAGAWTDADKVSFLMLVDAKQFAISTALIETPH